MQVRHAASLVLGPFLVGSACLVACGGGSSGPADGVSPSAVSTSGAFVGTLHAASDPPPLGDQSVKLELTYVDGGAPATGLTLTVVPWMPAMQHGTSIVPTVSETTPGTYTVSNAYLFMPGVWEMRTSIAASSGGGADKVSPALDIP